MTERSAAAAGSGCWRNECQKSECLFKESRYSDCVACLLYTSGMYSFQTGRSTSGADASKRRSDTSERGDPQPCLCLLYTSIEVIKAFGKTESSYAKFTKTAMDYADSFISWMKRCSIFHALMMVVTPYTVSYTHLDVYKRQD